MEETKSNKKKLILTIVGIICFVMILLLGVLFYNWRAQQKKIETMQNEIITMQDGFKNTDKRNEKFNLLKSTLETYNKYLTSNETYDEVTESYQNLIETMKSYFTDEYDKILSENTISNVSEVADKEILNSAMVELQDLSKVITDEREIVCNKNEESSYISEIESLVVSYEKRYEELEKEEILNKYNTTIADNTLDDVSAITDKQILNSAIDNLNALLTTVQSDIALNEDEIGNFQTQIETLTSSYKARLDEIKKSEKKTNATTSTTTSTPSTTPSVSDWRNNMTGYYTDSTGEVTWFDAYGNIYDANGNYLANQHDFF